MIPESTVTAFIAAFIFTLPLPIILLIILGIRRKIKWLSLLAGAGAFFLSQIVLRIPLLNVLSTQGWYQDFTKHYLLYVLALSLSAGLFEESARYGGAVLLKERRSFKDAVSFGLGHAFCELVIVAGITHINNITLCLLINSGNDAVLSAFPADVIQKAANTFMTVHSADIYWGILERFSAVLFHVFATVLVFRSVREKKARYYILAVAAHTVFNLSGVLLARFAGIVVSEAVLLILALTAGGYVMKQTNYTWG